jgi:hypothetical protein
MRKVCSLLTAGLLAGGVTTATLAGQHDKGAAGGAHKAPAAMAPENMQGGHTMSGTISKIDHSKGTLSLKTEGETLVLYFPPEELKDYKEGDKMTVHLAIAKEAEL